MSLGVVQLFCIAFTALTIVNELRAQADWRLVSKEQQASSFELDREGRLFAVSDRLYRSTNAGNTWITYFEVGGGMVTALAVDSSNHYFTATSRGIFRSTNEGETWDSVHFEAVNAIEYIQGLGVIAATQTQVLTSSNGGETWIVLADSAGVDGFYPGTSILYIRRNSELYRVTPPSAVWTSVFRSPYPIADVAVLDDQRVWTVIPRDIGSVVQLSTDAGNSWEAGGLGVADAHLRSILVRDGSVLVGGGLHDAVDPTIRMGPVLYRSFNGLEWSRSTGSPEMGAIQTLFLLKPQDVLASTDSGMFKGVWLASVTRGVSVYLNLAYTGHSILIEGSHPAANGLIEFRDILGRTLFDLTLESGAREIALPQLQPGVYYARMIAGGQVLGVLKFLKRTF